MMKNFFVLLSAVLLLCTFSGCASIVSKSNWPVTVQTNPTGAHCTLYKGSGVQLQSGETPMTIVLDASNGYFSRAKYTLECKKEGYETSKSEFTSSMNNWYWGNILLGGLIGMVIVDPATGAMWKLDDTHVVSMSEDTSISKVKLNKTTIVPVASE